VSAGPQPTSVVAKFKNFARDFRGRCPPSEGKAAKHLSSSNFLTTVDAAARVFIQSGVVTVLKKGPTSAIIGDTAPSIVVLHGDCAVRASKDKACGLKTVKGNGEYLATLASEGKTPVGGKSAAGEACHKEENCG
jgi:hypothetical protein